MHYEVCASEKKKKMTLTEHANNEEKDTSSNADCIMMIKNRIDYLNKEIALCMPNDTNSKRINRQSTRISSNSSKLGQEKKLILMDELNFVQTLFNSLVICLSEESKNVYQQVMKQNMKVISTQLNTMSNLQKEVKEQLDSISMNVNSKIPCHSENQTAQTWSQMVQKCGPTKFDSKDSFHIYKNKPTFTDAVHGGRNSSYGRIRIENVPTNLESYEIKEKIQKQLVEANINDIKILRVVLNATKPEGVVHFFPESKSKQFKECFNSCCLPMKLIQPKKNIIIHNIPIQEDTLDQVQIQLKEQNITTCNIHWLSRKNTTQPNKTHSSIIVDISDFDTFTNLNNIQRIILFDDFKKISQFDYNYKKSTILPKQSNMDDVCSE